MKDEGQTASSDFWPGFYFLPCDVPDCVPGTVHKSCTVAGGSPRAGLLGPYIYLGPFQNMGII